MGRQTLSEEDRLVDWLRRTLPEGESIGDDAALLPAAAWAVTMDTQIAGVHLPFDPDPAQAARRLLAVNLSDLAAMGAEPAYAFLSLSAPPAFDRRRFFLAFRKAAHRHGVILAGGDLSRQDHLVAVMTLLGRRTERGRWLTRKDARAGHRLWVGGTLGEAALGLQLMHRGATLTGRTVHVPEAIETRSAVAAARRAVRRQIQPRPQTQLGRWLATTATSGAAIDVSDGLARDLHRLCRASGVGAIVEDHAMPLPEGGAAVASALDVSLRELALFGGEDYVLLFTLPPTVQPPASMGCHPIGTVCSAQQVLIDRNGRRLPLPDQGWDHLTDKAQ